MADFSKISYYDLKWEAKLKRLTPLIGREDELFRLNRTLLRRAASSAIILGKSGVGTTTFLRGWAAHASNSEAFKSYAITELIPEAFHNISIGQNGFSGKYSEAFAGLPTPTIIIIDGFGSIIHNKSLVVQTMTRLLRSVAEDQNNRVVLSLEPHEYQWLSEQDPSFCRLFEVLTLKTQPAEEQEAIITTATERLITENQIIIKSEIITQIIGFCQKFPTLGQLPSSAIRVADEAVAEALSRDRTEVTITDIQRVVADKTGIPFQQLAANETELLRKLLPTLQQSIIGQDSALVTIANIIQRAKLGLKNPHRPLGSFLILGPSGVGKTETAKVLASALYGTDSSFLRIDMSEFGESNTVPRLLGAPPGYVGYEAGGALTNHVSSEPYSLILLDEIEKAHSKIFDIFLQILDDGRVTSGQGQMVDFTQTVLMATSNVAVEQIISAEDMTNIHDESFLRESILPELQKHFRTEFLNRFDAIILFNPLSDEHLLDIALLEISKIEERVKVHNINFDIDPEILRTKISEIIDPRLGARPVKRFIENTCETLIAEALLHNS